jgi:hypothetical protein
MDAQFIEPLLDDIPRRRSRSRTFPCMPGLRVMLSLALMFRASDCCFICDGVLAAQDGEFRASGQTRETPIAYFVGRFNQRGNALGQSPQQ